VSSILVIEDNPLNMKLVRDVLVHYGHRVLEARTGLEGLDLAQRHRPDLILMDIQLPDIDGATALGRIRQQRELDAVPVLAVSASVMPDEQQRVLSSGFDAFITKPLSLPVFLAAVDAALTTGRGR
jgi:two-component system cell cycle response regulator DivK